MILKPYSNSELEKYLKNDEITLLLKKYSECDVFACQKWLIDMPAKRMIYADVFHELLHIKGKRVLDIGGGYCGISDILAQNHDYTLVDIMAHDKGLFEERVKNTKIKWIDSDWSDFNPETKYDYIIANDLFPNVDQRLESFIKKFSPFAKKLIVTLTCHESERIYKVKRVDADEYLTMRAWNADITSLVLKSALKREIILEKPQEESIFKNGRSVYKLEINA